MSFFKIVFSKSLETHTNEHKKLQESTKKVSPPAQRPELRPSLTPEPGVDKQRLQNLSKDFGERNQVLGYIKFFSLLKNYSH